MIISTSGPTLNVAGIPRDLKRRRRWMVWKWEQHDGQPKKVPYSAKTGQRYTGKKAELARFEEVYAAYETDIGWGGVAIDVTPNMELVFIDLDRCVIDGVVADWAMDIVNRFQTYTEYSASGTGLKLVVAGKKPRSWKNLRFHGRKVEVFDSKSRILTGNRLPNTPNRITPNQTALNWLYVNSEEMATRRDSDADEIMEYVPSRYTDENVLASIKKNDPKGLFDRAYFNGDISHWKTDNQDGDRSAADFYVCCRILAHNGGNLSQAEAMWAASPLANREKFKRPDYRKVTLDNALAKVLSDGFVRGRKIGPDIDYDAQIQAILRAAKK